MTAPTLTCETDMADEAAVVRERLFDATRPPCPPWCTTTCTTADHHGDAVMHHAEPTAVPSVPDQTNVPHGVVTVRPWRIDELDRPSTAGIELAVDKARTLMEDHATLTAAQARQLAAALLDSADALDPAPVGEVDVPVTQVRIADLLSVDGQWLYVYGVDVDEPSCDVSLFVTVDAETVPEVDGDEHPHRFQLTDWVRVRRPGHPTATLRETEIPAGMLRLGDEVLTPNGWEPVEFLIHDGIGDWVQVYGSEEALDASRSWDLRPTDPVRIRPKSAVCAGDHTGSRDITEDAA